MNDSMAAMAKEVGLEYNFDQAIITNTRNAHRLLHFAREKGLQNELKERVFKAYYTEGKDTSDIEVLATLGEEVGMNAGEIREILQSDKYQQEVMRDQYEAQQMGASGVPFFVFNDKYAVSGAQPTGVFSQVLHKVWDEEKPTIIEQGAGVCDINGNCN